MEDNKNNSQENIEREKVKQEFEQFIKDNPELSKEARNRMSHVQSVANYNKKTYNSFSVHLRDKEYEKIQEIISANPKLGKSSIVKILLEQLSSEEIMEIVNKSEENKNSLKKEDCPAEGTE
jgi:hypothetical protein